MAVLRDIVRCLVFACVVAAGSGGGALAQAPVSGEGVDLGAVEVRLWYEETGRLSDNIAPPAAFAAWNTIIGSGQAAEIANDVLMTVEVTSGARAAYIDTPLVLEVWSRAGERLASRRVSGILTSEAGRAYKGLWVYDAGCAGALTFKATMGRVSRSVEVNFHCGE